MSNNNAPNGGSLNKSLPTTNSSEPGEVQERRQQTTNPRSAIAASHPSTASTQSAGSSNATSSSRPLGSGSRPRAHFHFAGGDHFPGDRSPSSSDTDDEDNHNTDTNRSSSQRLSQRPPAGTPVRVPIISITDDSTPPSSSRTTEPESSFHSTNSTRASATSSHAQAPSPQPTNTTPDSEHREVHFVDPEANDPHVTGQLPDVLPLYRVKSGSSSKKPGDDAKQKKKWLNFKEMRQKHPWMQRCHWPKVLAWVRPKLNKKGLRPVIRSAIAAWIAMLLLICRHTNRVLGQSSFFVVIVASLFPPMEPVAPMLWKTAYQFVFLFSAWAWTIVASKLATVSRGSPSPAESLQVAVSQGFQCTVSLTNVNQCLLEAIYQGYFVRALPSIIWALFEFVGVAVIMRIKVKYPPLTFSCVFSCICVIISACYGPLYPYFTVSIGLFFIIPFCVQTAIAVGCTLFILPQTCNSAYTESLQGLATKSKCILQKQREMLATSPSSAGWTAFSSIDADVASLKDDISKMQTNEQFMDTEFTYGRLKGSDLIALRVMFEKIALRMTAFSYFNRLIVHNVQIYDDDVLNALDQDVSNNEEASLLHSRHERQHSRDGSRSRISRTSSIATSGTQSRLEPRRVASTQSLSHGQNPQSYVSLSDFFLGRTNAPSTAHNSVADDESEHHTIATKSTAATGRSKGKNKVQAALSKFYDAMHHSYQPVGLLEAQHYMTLENKLPYHPPQLLESLVSCLNDATAKLLNESIVALDGIYGWLDDYNSDRLNHLFSRQSQRRNHSYRVNALRIHYRRLRAVMADFDEHRLFDVKAPIVDLLTTDDLNYLHSLRSLYVIYFYEAHLFQVIRGILQILEATMDLEHRRQLRRLWWPLHAFRFAVMSQFTKSDDYTEDSAPNDPEEDVYKTFTEARNPDAEPPNNICQLIDLHLINFCKHIFSADNRHAIKVGMLAVICTIPSFCRGSAIWYYRNRGFWTVILGTMNLARFSGDTIYGYLARILGTLFGCTVGMMLWYISSGHGKGNSYGLAVVMAIAFPIIMFIRIHLIYLTPMPASIFAVSIALTVGYSWKSFHEPGLVTLGVGWDVAYRRFLTVAAGITAAFIFSMIPRPVTAHRMIRTTLGKLLIQIGSIHCDISNFARRSSHNHIDTDIQSTILKLSQTLMALKKRLAIVKFEPALIGRWPRDRYEQLIETEQELLDLLNSFMTCLTTLDENWTYALMFRIGWLEPKFIASQLAVLYMCSTSLLTENPLPQIVPAPLVDRFFTKNGDIFLPPLSINEPSRVDITLLDQKNYVNFAVGCTIAYAIVNHIDRIMYITKSLCGELYHIDGWPHSRYFDEDIVKKTIHGQLSERDEKSNEDIV
ncbi:hypothetical protein SJAG_04423 [Schizosaccharomyces japonicus yFS275]|uniref:ER transporter 6TM N-terminal domain-containing protein n=1 Tax=Schizosaccharomyces japonicus (strain yFS275 / FY16936) TaxID=402676 RepID=B6K6T4_SCHJY|nr:hypothetical protein SJAG_04423 [Schizosaccharomyces japonicus yFS275]EEB09238.1 hypothetical protein SJAG_04423 [Schizosaccharomyces japonicus yFS275]